MSVLLNCQSISKSYGARYLFKGLSLTISKGDRIGLIGLNGCGKSTFLKILAGIEEPEEGGLVLRRGLRVGYVPQTCEFDDLSLQKILVDAVIDDIPDYEKERLADNMLRKLGFKGNEPSAEKLSGGWKKRLRLAVELMKDPEILLLDEPTNHLDLEGILWLEEFLKNEALTYLVVSHDRFFLQGVTNRVIEIDKTYPEGIFAIDCSYKDFLHQKDLFIKGQLQQEKRVATKVRRETEWLRAGVKARTTKAQSRIDEAGEIMDEYADLKKRNKQTQAKIDFEGTKRETRKLLVAKNLSKAFGERLLFSNLDFTLSPGTRIGLMGHNGSGKTTLLSLLEGKLETDTGTIKKAEDLKIVYFDQHRIKLPLDSTLKDALAPNSEYVSFRGSKIHINAWAKRFLFEPDLLKTPIKRLSGGERARITIAHLMLQPADILLLDEPTNDLDIPTLETLEESLLDFPGAIVLISHDRCLLDRVCNSVLAFGDPKKTQVFADYNQWKAWVRSSSKPAPVEVKKEKTSNSYAKKKELEKIERKIAKLEKIIQELNKKLEDTAIANSPEKLSKICDEIALHEAQVTQLYITWEEIES